MANHTEVECPRRKVDCQYCQLSGEYQFIEGQHKEECPKFPINCPNKCEVGSIPCEAVLAHRQECPSKLSSVNIKVLDVEIQWLAKIGVNMKRRKWKNIYISLQIN